MNQQEIKRPKKKLLTGRPYYRPFDYPQFITGWEISTSMFWTVAEINFDLDVYQFYNLLTKDEQDVLKMLLGFFTQTDVEVSKGYITLLQVINLIEAQIMMFGFGYMETIHIRAYETLNIKLRLSESSFRDFVKYKSTSAKYDYLNQYSVGSPQEIARTIAFISGFVEGFMIFSSFCILFNFPRFGLMKGLGQVASWSLRDETLHNNYMTQLFHAFIIEYADEINFELLEKEILETCKHCIILEDAFIDECFEGRTVRGITPDVVKSYIRKLAKLRINALGFKYPEESYFQSDITLYPEWIKEATAASELVDFFSNRPTEYAKMNYSWKDIINNSGEGLQDDWDSI